LDMHGMSFFFCQMVCSDGGYCFFADLNTDNIGWEEFYWCNEVLLYHSRIAFVYPEKASHARGCALL